LALFLLPALLSPAGAAENAVYNLNMAGGYALRHPVVKNVFLPWIERIKQRSGGRINISYFAPNTLGAEEDCFTLTRKGHIDIGHNQIARHPQLFPVSSAADLPGRFSHPPSASVALWRTYNNIPEMQLEFAGVKLLSLHTSAPAQFCWAGDMDVLLPEQVKGRKILVGSADQARVVHNMGGTPLITPVSDFQNSLARGLADGCVLPLESMRALTTGKGLKSVTIGAYSLRSWWIAMSLEAWNKLPPDLQRIVEEESGEKLAYLSGVAVMEAERGEEDYLKAGGVRLNYVEEKKAALWLEYTLPPLKKEWFRKMTAHGLPAQRIFDEGLRMRQEAAALGRLKYSYN
jgi:TRAP-type C4-dicarboxylate transport system substrate-binding protein